MRWLLLLGLLLIPALALGAVKEDFNTDGEVNILDLVLLAKAISSQDLSMDIKIDGEINIFDLILIVKCMGKEQYCTQLEPPIEPPTDYDVIINPGDDFKEVVLNSPPGSTFYVKSGKYNLERFRPRDRDTFIGEQGAIITGAIPVTNWQKEGNYWVSNEQTAQGQVHGGCMWIDGVRYEGCRYPEDIFINNVPLWQVLSLNEVEGGKWYFDYANDKIYMLDDPTGKKVELSVYRHAFEGSAKDVTIKGFIIEKYAVPAQHAAIHAQEGTWGKFSQGWIIENNEVRYNHGVGVLTADGTQVRNNYIHTNGQNGVAGKGTGVLIEGNRISNNNYAGYSWGWVAGGVKLAFTSGVIIRDNTVYNNGGPGLWVDGNNSDVLMEDNHVYDNDGPGLFHEISRNGIYRNNLVERNGWVGTSYAYGAGILIAHSTGVEVYGNTLIDNMRAIVGLQQTRNDEIGTNWYLDDFSVHNNIVRDSRGIRIGDDNANFIMGVVQGSGDITVFDRNLRFYDNTYEISHEKPFAWVNRQFSWEEWQAFGQDLDGSYRQI